MTNNSDFENEGESVEKHASEMSGPEAVAAGKPEFVKVLRANVVREVSARLNVLENEIDQDTHLIALGLDSLVLFSMTAQLAEWLERDLPATLLFEINSINELIEQCVMLFFPENQ